ILARRGRGRRLKEGSARKQEKLQLLEMITNVKQSITKVIVLRGGGVHRLTDRKVLSFLTKKAPPTLGPSHFPSAQHDHFRYPLFHFCYPFKQLQFSFNETHHASLLPPTQRPLPPSR